MVDEIQDMVCFCCRNNSCENYTIYRGYLMCEYCLDDWLNNGQNDFESWCIQHKEDLDKEDKTIPKEVQEG